MNKKVRTCAGLLILAVLIISLTGCQGTTNNNETGDSASAGTSAISETASGNSDIAPPDISLSDIPEYRGEEYITVNDGIPFFEDDELTTQSYESYSELDSLGRVGTAVASVGTDLMPTEERGDISSIHPTGWVQNFYDFIESEALYNRGHLIAHQLTGENDNEKNLATMTRQANVTMIPFENMVGDYIRETDDHVMYRVTPMFDGEDLLATGFLLEAKSVEDDGESVEFCVFVYNAEEGVTLDYATGDNWLAEADSDDVNTEDSDTEASDSDDTNTGSTDADESNSSDDEVRTYILNTSSKRIHDPSCDGVSEMSERNKEEYTGTISELEAQGYTIHYGCLG